jgi:hypothetical protein
MIIASLKISQRKKICLFLVPRWEVQNRRREIAGSAGIGMVRAAGKGMTESAWMGMVGAAAREIMEVVWMVATFQCHSSMHCMHTIKGREKAGMRGMILSRPLRFACRALIQFPGDFEGR